MKKLGALLFFFSALALWSQDKPHRFVETGFDVHGSFANSYLRTGDIFREKIFLDLTKLSDDLGNGLGIFFDARWELFLNFNLGAVWGFGFFTGMDGMGQLKIPQSMVSLLSEGSDPDKTYSDDLGLGGAVFYEAGFWGSAKIRRIKFTVRPAYYLPLAYVSNPRVNYAFAIEDNGTIRMEGKYHADLYTPISHADVVAMGDSIDMDDFAALPGSVDLADMLGKGGVDLVLRAEYPVYHNFIIGGTLGHIPLIPAQLTEKYSLSGDFKEINTIEEILNDGFEMPNPDLVGKYGTDHKMVFRPFKIGVDAVYRPFNIRLLTVRPDLALVFNSIYNTPVYLDFGISGELNLADIFIVSIGTRLEDLVWKERIGLTLNLRAVELMAGITTQSQQFLRSFQGAGFGVDFGLRLGF